MLRAKFDFASSSSSSTTTKTTQYVPPSSRCLQIIDNNTDDNNGSFDISVVSGNTIQVATVDFILGEEQQSDNNNSKSSIRVRTGAASECSIQVPLSSSGQQRIVSSLYQPSSSMLLTAAPSSNGSYDISYVKIDGNKMNEFKKQQHQKEDDSSDRRRQREDDSSSRVLSVASSFAVPASNENNSSTLFSAAPSSGGSAFIGLDSISSSSVFVTNGLTRTSSILDIETQKLASTFVPHDGLPSATCSLPCSGNQEQSSTTASSSAILAVSTGSFITLWDTRQQSPISTNLSSSASSVLQHRSSLMPLSDSITCMSPFPSSNDSSTCSYYLLTGSADRAVTLWDIRKWSKQHVAQNVLKFAPASVAVASSSSSSTSSTTNDSASSSRPGCFVTASGSDSEVRNLFIPLPENSSNSSSTTKNTSNNPSGGKKNKNKDKEQQQPQQENVNGATGGSFRQRLQDATHCMTSWHGSWVGSSSSSSSSSKQKFTVGMSRDFEVFVAKF